MTFLSNLKPKFWDHIDISRGPHKYLFNFRKIWKLTVLLTLVVSIIPLIILAMIDYWVSYHSVMSENILRTSRLVSNTRRSVSYFLDERKAAIDFIILNETYELLNSTSHLERTLKNLQKGFGGFIDLGVINDKGVQISYTGPYELTGKDYSDATWFKDALDKGVYISDVFLGFRNIPHIIIAVKHALPDGGFYLLRATIDTERFTDLLAGLHVGGDGDAFLINREGDLQTPSRYHGEILSNIDIQTPEYSERSQVELIDRGPNNRLLIGYAYIHETPFILMIIKNQNRLMAPWYETQMQITGFLLISITTTVFVILGGITYLVNQIYLADQRRLQTMHEIEYANKMASLGRLSAGVAHEINNPLAIINEKAGLIKDLFTFTEKYNNDPRLMGLIDSVIRSVERCGAITRRLLNFARHKEIKIHEVDVREVVHEVLGFVGKESEYRSIDIQVEMDPDIPEIKSDQGRLQEVFLNLVTNAFAAIKEGGSLKITGAKTDKDYIVVDFTDDGHGIPESDIERVFEPFFSTRTGKGGTGLGLSITYGLVQELGGTIKCRSKVGEGATFTVTLPIATDVQEKNGDKKPSEKQ